MVVGWSARALVGGRVSRLGRVKWMMASDEEEDGRTEEAAFGAGGAAGEDGAAGGMGGEEVVPMRSAVGDAVEEGLCPVPRGVEADGPPEGAGAVEGEGEDAPARPTVSDTPGGFAGVAEVGRAEEEDGEEEGGGPRSP